MKQRHIAQIKIADRVVGADYPVFIVAEISGNHNRSFRRAAAIIKAAARAGADAVKLQTYTPDTITIDSDKKWFRIKSSNKNWDGKTLYQLYQEAYTPWDWQPKLKKIAEELGLILFSTPFDNTAVDFLEKIKVPAYKISSYEITDLELLKKVGRTRKPVILSRGMATIGEIRKAIDTLKKNGTKNIAVLHCVSEYPALPEDMNLKTVPDIAGRFKVVSGLSDHTLGINVPAAAAAAGASIIEKHLTLKRKDGGPDAGFSLEPDEFKKMVGVIRETEKTLGKPTYTAFEDERKNRRSLFAVKDIKKGDKFTADNVKSIRPGYGLPVEFFRDILGAAAKKDIERGTPLAWNLIVKKRTRLKQINA